MAFSRVLLSSLLFACGNSARVAEKASEGSSSAGSTLIKNDKGYFKVYWPAPTSGSCSAVLFSVGTAMGQHEYPQIAEALTARGILVGIVDPQPGSMTKLDVDKLTAAFTEAKANLLQWSGGACGSVNTWLMGGHSAGGGTAHKVFEANAGMTDAVFSVDPFAKGDLGGNIQLPGLYWGFSKSSCFVDPKDSSEAGYVRSQSGKRVLAKVTVTKKFTMCGSEPDYFHCSISDGCGIACGNCGRGTPDSFYEDVAESVKTFAGIVRYGRWGSLSDVAVTSATPVTWFMGDEMP